MNYLVDTNILCEPRQRRPDEKVVSWLRENESKLYTSVLVLAEIRYGIDLLPLGSGKRAELQRWHTDLVNIMAGRVLSINFSVAEEWARLQVEMHFNHVVLPVIDSLLAATARRYQLTMATDNVNHFQSTGVKVLNPFLM